MAGNAELTGLCARARQRPLAPRRPLHEALRGSRVTVLTAGGDGASGSLDVWADRDRVFEAIWVPVFTSETLAADFAAGPRPPGGSALSPVTGRAEELFSALLDVPLFGGVRLDPAADGSTRLERHDVSALAEGLVPDEAPAFHGLGGGALELPEGVPCRFGDADPTFGPQGRRAVFPAAPGFSLQDFRCLVELELGGARAWAPCRNLAAALATAPVPAEDRERHEETLVETLVAFCMYGEAEALCARRLKEAGRRAWALGHLGRVLRRAGRLTECVAHCRTALSEAPGEARLYRSLALACAELEDLEGAREAARGGLGRFPDDPTLRRFA